MSFATDKMDKPLQYFRMNVDRFFIKGFGTIVTGTVAHGKAKLEIPLRFCLIVSHQNREYKHMVEILN